MFRSHHRSPQIRLRIVDRLPLFAIVGGLAVATAATVRAQPPTPQPTATPQPILASEPLLAASSDPPPGTDGDGESGTSGEAGESGEAADRLAGPPRVDLSDAGTLRDAFDAIRRDAAVGLRYRGDMGRPLRPIEEPLLFWQAVDRIADQAGLDVDFYAGDRQTLHLMERPEDRPDRSASAIYAGVYRIEPRAVVTRRDLIRPRLSQLQVTIQIAWEPGLTPIGLSLPIEAIEGELDDGSGLVPQATGRLIEVKTHREIASSDFSLPLELPESRGSNISRLRATVRAMLPGPTGRFELSLGDPRAAETIGDLTVRIEGIRQTDALLETRLGIELEDAGRALESHRQWVFENRATVIRPDGGETRHVGMEVYRQTLSGVGVAYLFDLSDPPADLKLVYESPTSVRQDETTFELRDIGLP